MLSGSFVLVVAVSTVLPTGYYDSPLIEIELIHWKCINKKNSKNKNIVMNMANHFQF